MNKDQKAVEKEAKARFQENMGAFFHDLLRASGITMTPHNADQKLRSIGERMASSIESASQRKAIEVIRKLQNAVTEAFVAIETELRDLKNLVSNHHAIVSNLLKDSKKDSLILESLRDRVETLERLALSQSRDEE